MGTYMLKVYAITVGIHQPTTYHCTTRRRAEAVASAWGVPKARIVTETHPLPLISGVPVYIPGTLNLIGDLPKPVTVAAQRS